MLDYKHGSAQMNILCVISVYTQQKDDKYNNNSNIDIKKHWTSINQTFPLHHGVYGE